MYRFVASFVLVALYMGPNSVNTNPMDGAVIHKANIMDLIPNQYEMPASCETETFCFEKGSNYPEDTIEKLLKDMVALPIKNKDGMPMYGFGTVDFRNGDTSPDCPSNNDFMYQPIYYIRDEFDTVRVVVQSPAKFQQIYTVKWCQNQGEITEDTTHFIKGSEVLKNFKVECVNTIMDFEFFVLSEDGESIELARAIDGIPVFCASKYNFCRECGNK